METVKKVEPRPNKGQTRRLPKARTTGASIIGQDKFLYFASIDHALVRDGTQQIQTLLDAIEGKAGTRR